MQIDSEQQPLLDDDDSNRDVPQISITQVAHALAALRAGALPSTSQLASLLRSFLRSPLLEVEGTIFSPEYGHGRLGVGGLTREGEQVREAVRETVAAALRILVQHNSDDRWQEFVVAVRKSEVDISESHAAAGLAGPSSGVAARPRNSRRLADEPN